MVRALAAAAVAALTLIACGGDDPPPIVCTQSPDCPSTQVCVGGQCFDALGRTYGLTLQIDVAPNEPDGTPWDSDGSAPDVLPHLSASTDTDIPTGVLDWPDHEAFSASWDAVQFTPTDDSPLELSVVDDDPIGADSICDVALPETLAMLHLGGAVVEAESCRVTVVLVPLATP